MGGWQAGERRIELSRECREYAGTPTLNRKYIYSCSASKRSIVVRERPGRQCTWALPRSSFLLVVVNVDERRCRAQQWNSLEYRAKKTCGYSWQKTIWMLYAHRSSRGRLVVVTHLRNSTVTDRDTRSGRYGRAKNELCPVGESVRAHSYCSGPNPSTSGAEAKQGEVQKLIHKTHGSTESMIDKSARDRNEWINLIINFTLCVPLICSICFILSC